ncbi:MAG: multiheme c-type cytochrome, partial [Gallionellaceae bacterium]
MNPDDCGACHPKQYEGWRGSRHSHAMGAGVMGQLLDIKPNEVDRLRECTPCHAPLAEQELSLREQLRGGQQASALHERGLVCAGCHVRRHVHYGPAPTQPSSNEKSPHNGFVSSAAFEDGRFCASCHQFGKDGYQLNGKPLENTYAEWQASPYAKQGQQCQACHMQKR